jgi:hypothetical protein
MRTLIVTDAGRIQSTTDVSDRFGIKAPVDKAFDALTGAFRDVGVEPTQINGALHQVGNPGFQRTGKLGNTPLSAYFECGSDMTGLRANRDRITIALSATVLAVAGGTSEVRTQLTASSRNMMGSSTDAIACGSTGKLEQALRVATELRTVKP